MTCWGQNVWGQTDAPTGPHTSLVAGVEHSCALNDAGEIVCWGASVTGQTDVPDALQQPGAVTTGSAAG